MKSVALAVAKKHHNATIRDNMVMETTTVHHQQIQGWAWPNIDVYGDMPPVETNEQICRSGNYENFTTPRIC